MVPQSFWIGVVVDSNSQEVVTTVIGGIGGTMGIAVLLQKFLSVFAREKVSQGTDNTSAAVTHAHLAEITRLAELVSDLSKNQDDLNRDLTIANATLLAVGIHVRNMPDCGKCTKLVEAILAALDRNEKLRCSLDNSQCKVDTSTAKIEAKIILEKLYGPAK